MALLQSQFVVLPASPGPFRFLDLPVELQAKILEFATVDHLPYRVAGFGSRYRSIDNRWHSTSLEQVWGTCLRRVSKEVKAHFDTRLEGKLLAARTFGYVIDFSSKTAVLECVRELTPALRRIRTLLDQARQSSRAEPANRQRPDADFKLKLCVHAVLPAGPEIARGTLAAWIWAQADPDATILSGDTTVQWRTCRANATDGRPLDRFLKTLERQGRFGRRLHERDQLRTHAEQDPPNSFAQDACVLQQARAGTRWREIVRQEMVDRYGA